MHHFFCTANQQIMDKFVKGLPGKCRAADESTPHFTTTKTKTRKYDDAYLSQLHQHNAGS